MKKKEKNNSLVEKIGTLHKRMAHELLNIEDQEVKNVPIGSGLHGIMS